MPHREPSQDTILWKKESDAFTRRVFLNLLSPYQSPQNKDIILQLTKIFRKLKIQPQRILDLGCSAGFKLYNLKREFPRAKLYGIDPGEESIALAKKNVPAAQFKKGFAHLIDYEDGAFDVTLLYMVLQWIPRKYLLKSISEIDRVTSRYIYISEYFPFKPTSSISHHNKRVRIYKQNYAALFEATRWWKVIYMDVKDAAQGEDFKRMECVLKKYDLDKTYTHKNAVLASDIKSSSKRSW